MIPHYTSDNEAFDAIRAGDVQGLGYIYKKCRTQSIRFLLSLGADQENAKDIYQDAIVVLHKKIDKGLSLQTATTQTYLNRICENKWLGFKKSQRRIIRDTDDFSDLVDDAHDDEEQNLEQVTQVKQALVIIGLKGNCKELLEMHYFQDRKLDEITRYFNYTNSETASNQIYKCRKRLEEIIAKRLKP